MSTLAGKVAVISGGTTGIGLAIAQRFVAEGAHVFIFGRRQAQLDQAAKLIGRNVTAKSVGARAQRSAFSLGARTGGFRRIGKFHRRLWTSYALRDTPHVVNSVSPGYVKTDLTRGNGLLTPQEAAKTPVKYALLGDDAVSGRFVATAGELPW